MATPARLVLLLTLTILLLFSNSVLTKDTKPKDVDNEDEDLSFLEEPTEQNGAAHNSLHDFPDQDEFDEDGDDDFDNYSDFDESGIDHESYKEPEVDDKDVVVLKERNFTTIIENNKFVMVEFYAPWCGHCQALAPEYAAATTELKGEDVILAKVDATEENDLSHEYDVQGFPTIYFFVDGVHKLYNGQRTK